MHLFHVSLRHVEDSLPVQTEAVVSIFPLDQTLDAVANVFGELFEEHLSLLFRQGPHLDLDDGFPL